MGLDESPEGFGGDFEGFFYKAQGGLEVELISGLASSFFLKDDSAVV